jgi:hypothetical protein
MPFATPNPGKLPHGGGGCHRRGGGFSSLNIKPDTAGQRHLPSQGFQNNYFGLDAINKPQKCISSNTISLYLSRSGL